MVCGWAGSFALDDGINVISGTGSMSYGQRAERRVRVGGWGELFGDEGSGYWIAIRGLQALSQMSDGRLPAGPILDVFREHLGLRSDLDVVDVVLNRWRGSRRDIAALSRQVVEAAQHGDSIAARILSDAATELVLLIETACRHLGFAADEAVPVSCSGGVFSALEIVSRFEQELARRGRRYDLRPGRFRPVVGAALYAAKLAGAPLTPAALERLQVTTS
jgi:N-acetylglucosamine kinase-like BadF-type ATPase